MRDSGSWGGYLRVNLAEKSVFTMNNVFSFLSLHHRSNDQAYAPPACKYCPLKRALAVDGSRELVSKSSRFTGWCETAPCVPNSSSSSSVLCKPSWLKERQPLLTLTLHFLPPSRAPRHSARQAHPRSQKHRAPSCPNLLQAGWRTSLTLLKLRRPSSCLREPVRRCSQTMRKGFVASFIIDIHSYSFFWGSTSNTMLDAFGSCTASSQRPPLHTLNTV